jgi:hypothetical protein
MRSGLRILVLMGLLLSVAPAAHATLYCVSALSGLQTALNSAGSNNQDDEFRFRSVNFALTAQLLLSVVDAHNVTLSGGWGAACSALDGGTTVLDGQASFGILHVDAAAGAGVSVSRFDFQNAMGSLDHGGALWVIAPGQISIELNRFFANRHSVAAGALTASTFGNLWVRNNLFYANQAPDVGAAELYAQGGAAYLTNNTVVGNSGTLAGSLGGILVSGAAQFTVANNILWSNSGSNLLIVNSALLLNNDVGAITGNPPQPGSQNNLAVAPEYAGGLFNFRLAPDTALVDAGVDSPPGGLTTVDLDGHARWQSTHVDIGAYETTPAVLFANGFE